MGNGIGAIGWARGTALAALTGAALFVLLAAGPARAGTYDVWSCRGPGGEPLPAQAWSLTTFDEPPGGGIVLDDACASGGALTLAIDPDVRFDPPLKPTALAVLDLPAGVRVRSYDLRWSLRTAPSGLASDFYYAAGVRERAGGAPSDWGCASVQRPQFPCTERGDPDDPDHPSNEYARSGLQLDGLELFAGCTTDGCTGLLPLLRDGEVAAELKLFGARVELEDAAAPALTGLGGSLASGQPISGTAALVVEGADAGGGIAAVSLSVDGGPPQMQALQGSDGACAVPFTRAQPCPPEVARAFAVEAGELTPGPHSAAGTIVDAAGNVTSF
ncbi:MAG TPA: hypothetical protein VLC53_05445, partial [Myxococcota bacterium]|nr:hypothetical protein [Myxococcota bacterium]